MADDVVIQGVVVFELVFEEEQKIIICSTFFGLKIVVKHMSVNSTYLYVDCGFPTELNGFVLNNGVIGFFLVELSVFEFKDVFVARGDDGKVLSRRQDPECSSTVFLGYLRIALLALNSFHFKELNILLIRYRSDV